MMGTRRGMLGTLAATALGGMLGGCGAAANGVRIGFVVKMPQEQWFQDEWRFARAAARDLGFSIIEIGAEDGDRLLSASADGTLRLWDPGTGTLLQTLPGHEGPIVAAVIDATHDRIASAGEDRTVRLWSLATGELLRTLSGHTDLTVGVCFAGDGQRLAARRAVQQRLAARQAAWRLERRG